jgi:hypothetical protein
MKYELVPVSQDRVISDNKTLYLQARKRDSDSKFWDSIQACSADEYNANDKIFDEKIAEAFGKNCDVRISTRSVRQWEDLTEVWEKT